MSETAEQTQNSVHGDGEAVLLMLTYIVPKHASKKYQLHEEDM